MSGIKGINAGAKNWNYKHGETGTKLFRVWCHIHERCERFKHTHFKDYGGRGINVCEEWSEFLPFKAWALSSGYVEGLTIDRIDYDKGYEPLNCRWVDMKAQQNNKRSNRIITYKGVDYTLTQLAEKVGINKTTLKERLNAGWETDRAVETPIRLRTKGYRTSRKVGARMDLIGEDKSHPFAESVMMGMDGGKNEC